MGTLDFAQQGVGSVVPSRGMAAENAGSTLRSNEVGNAQERCRATFARGEREDFPEQARLRPRCGSDGDTSSTSGARVQLGGDKERVARGQAKKEGFSDCCLRSEDRETAGGMYRRPGRACAVVCWVRPGLGTSEGWTGMWVKTKSQSQSQGWRQSQRQRQRQVTQPEGRCFLRWSCPETGAKLPQNGAEAVPETELTECGSAWLRTARSIVSIV